MFVFLFQRIYTERQAVLLYHEGGMHTSHNTLTALERLGSI